MVRTRNDSAFSSAEITNEGEVKRLTEKESGELFRQFYKWLRQVTTNRRLLKKNEKFLRTQFYFAASDTISNLADANYLMRERLIENEVKQIFYLPSIIGALLSGDLRRLERLKKESRERRKVEDKVMSKVGQATIKVVTFLRSRFPNIDIPPKNLHSLDEKLKRAGRRFLRRVPHEPLGGSLQRETLIKEVFRKPRRSTRKQESNSSHHRKS